MEWNRPLIKRRCERYGLFLAIVSDLDLVQAFVGESSAGCGLEVVLQGVGGARGGQVLWLARSAFAEATADNLRQGSGLAPEALAKAGGGGGS